MIEDPSTPSLPSQTPSEPGKQSDNITDPLVAKLTYQEQLDFKRICAYFQLADDRNKRNFGMATFIKHLNLIHRYVVRDDGGDALRGLVCGILFGNGFLLVNTEKLKKLTRRSKSCVNGCFQRLGFGVFRETQDLNGFFAKIFPDIGPQLLNPRHWCIRKASDDAPICFISSLPLDISAKFGFPVETYQMISYHTPQTNSPPPPPPPTTSIQQLSPKPPQISPQPLHQISPQPIHQNLPMPPQQQLKPPPQMQQQQIQQPIPQHVQQIQQNLHIHQQRQIQQQQHQIQQQQMKMQQQQKQQQKAQNKPKPLQIVEQAPIIPFYEDIRSLLNRPQLVPE